MRLGKTPFDVVDPFLTLDRNLLGTNSGNLIYGAVAHKLFSTKDTEVDANYYRINAGMAAAVNDEYDGFIVHGSGHAGVDAVIVRVHLRILRREQLVGRGTVDQVPAVGAEQVPIQCQEGVDDVKGSLAQTHQVASGHRISVSKIAVRVHRGRSPRRSPPLEVTRGPADRGGGPARTPDVMPTGPPRPARGPSARPHTVATMTIPPAADRKSTRLNSSHVAISYAVFCLKKKTKSSYMYPE